MIDLVAVREMIENLQDVERSLRRLEELGMPLERPSGSFQDGPGEAIAAHGTD